MSIIMGEESILNIRCTHPTMATNVGDLTAYESGYFTSETGAADNNFGSKKAQHLKIVHRMAQPPSLFPWGIEASCEASSGPIKRDQVALRRRFGGRSGPRREVTAPRSPEPPSLPRFRGRGEWPIPSSEATRRLQQRRCRADNAAELRESCSFRSTLGQPRKRGLTPGRTGVRQM